MKKGLLFSGLVLCIAAIFNACDSGGKTADIIAPVKESEVMVPGLSVDEQQIFKEGRDLFFTSFTLDDGLGPFFAEDACGKCHDGAGRGPGKVLRIGRILDGEFDPMAQFGGPTMQFRTAMEDQVPETIPPEAEFVEFRSPPGMFGRGYIQAIPSEAIVSFADPYDNDHDGISGRPNFVIQSFVGSPINPQLGRFGIKAQGATVIDFADNAFLNDLGMTSPMRPFELPNPNSNAVDKKKGLDVTQETVDKVDKFIRMLDFPAMVDTSSSNFQNGRSLFVATGCQKCHISAMTTGASDISAVSYKTEYFYSDFLLHDMGTALSDHTLDGDADPQEFKTAVLRGMRFFKEFLHDGRAHTILEAIQLHAGEAQSVRDSFMQLSDSDRQKIVTFVSSL